MTGDIRVDEWMGNSGYLVGKRRSGLRRVGLL